MSFQKALISPLCLLLLYMPSAQAEIYKYQDASGKWHFSDKAPIQSQRPVETLNYTQKSQTPNLPFLDTNQVNGMLRYTMYNPLLIPVQGFLVNPDTKKKIVMKLVEPKQNAILFEQQDSNLKQGNDFYYVLGDPNAQPASPSILPPFTDFKPMKIGQGFNGKFSHQHPANQYALDISLPVGTKITAVKDGVVFYTKDDYALAGVSSPFFLDKANTVEILHEDGTYAVYAHLLLGGVKVKVGEHVKAGQVIGLSGNTGYSTGPHLHFVIRYNKQGKTRSVPFTVVNDKGQNQAPQQGNWLMPHKMN